MLKHLNILLKKKEKRLHYNGIKYLIGILILVIAISPVISTHAEKEGDVEIIIGTDTNLYGTHNQINCEIYFDDLSFYNESLYISYHIMDAVNEEIIQYENQRVWIAAPDASGFSNATIDIAIDKKYKNQKLIVQLDIVDTINQYWFSDLESNSFCSPTLYYKYDMGRMVAQKLKREIMDRPVIFAVNCAVSCVFIWAYITIKKRRKK